MDLKQLGLLFLGLGWAASLAALPLELDSAQGLVEVEGAEFFEDASGRLQVEDLDLIDFKTPPAALVTLSRRTSEVSPHLWVRLTLKNLENQQVSWFVNFKDPIDSPAKLFQLDRLGQYNQTSSLGQVPFAKGQALASRPFFLVLLEPKQTRQLMIRLVLEPRFYQQSPRFELLTPKAWAEARELGRLGLGFYLGIGLLLFLLSLIGWLWLKAKGYVYYALAILTLGLGECFWTGQGLDLINANTFHLYPELWGNVFFMVGLFALGLFCWRGLEVKGGERGRGLLLLLGLQFIALILGPAYHLLIDPNFQWIPILVGLSIFGLVLALWREGRRVQGLWPYIAPLGLIGLGWFLGLLRWPFAPWLILVAHAWVLGLFTVRLFNRREDQLIHKIRLLAEENRLRDEYNNRLLQKQQALTADLLSARAQAEEGAQSKGDLLVALANRFSVPLTRLLNQSRLAQSQNGGQALFGVEREGQDLLAQLGDLLEFSRLLGPLPKYLEAFDPKAELERCMAMHQDDLERLGIVAILETSTGIPLKVRLPRGRFDQLVLRLLGEALALTEGASLEVNLALAGPGELILCIQPTGLKLTEEELASRFEPSLSKAGLGFCIAKGLAEALDGELWVQDQMGLKVCCRIPFLAGQADPGQLGPDLCGQAWLISVSKWRAKRLGVTLPRLGVSLEWLAPELAYARLAQGECPDWILLDQLIPDSNPPSWIKGLSVLELERPPALIQLSQNPELIALEADALAQALSANTPPPGPSPEPQRDWPQMAERYPMRVVVAEDDLVSRLLIKTAFEKLGYHPRIAANGKKLLDLLLSDDADLVLLDIRMPVMDGIEAAKRIQELFPKARRPILVACTSNAFLPDLELYRLIGLDDLLVKPLIVNNLERQIGQWYQKLLSRRGEDF